MAVKSTQCPKGHEFTEENTQRRKDGSRRCRECNNTGARDGMQALRGRNAAGADLRAQFQTAAAQEPRRPAEIGHLDLAYGAPWGETRGLPKGVSLGTCGQCKTLRVGENVQFERDGFMWCTTCSLDGDWRVYSKWMWGKWLDESMLVTAEVNTYLKPRGQGSYHNVDDASQLEDVDASDAANPRPTRTPVDSRTWRGLDGGSW